MTGVAAAVRDVRLGDVAVATEGIVDYDQVRRFHGMVSLRRHTDGMSAEMRRAVTARRELACSPETGREDWSPWLNEWFVVRGIGDEASSRKVDENWRPYARLVAARCVRGLLQHCRPFT